MKELVEDFNTYLTHIGYSQNTKKMLPRLLNDFLHYTNKSLADIDKQDIITYYEHLKTKPKKGGAAYLSESYINHHIYTLNVFFNYQLELGNITNNPMSTLEFPRPNSKPREIVTQQEVKTLFNACITYRERAVLNLCYGLGLRRSEVFSLNTEDINFQTAQAIVREGKGKKRRVIPISESVLNGLKTYLESERTSTKTNAFITTKRGERAAGDNLGGTLKKILDRTDIEKNITPHCLRHSIATHLLENGLSVENVRDFLGHKHLETTQIYTRVKNKQLWNLKR